MPRKGAMENLTFKRYVESRTQLLEALKTTPRQSTEYVVRKYCKIPLGESKDQREYISLKPKQKIIVNWLYEDIEDPTPLSVWFDGKDTNELRGREFATFWSGEKLDKWLSTNARELF